MNRLLSRFLGRALLLLMLFSLWATAFSQNGTPYLQHFKLPAHISNQNWAYQQDQDGLILILNRKGIFEFDGFQWFDVKIPGRPIAFNYKKHLFYCTNRGVGYMKGDRRTQYSHYDLLKSMGTDLYFKLVDFNDNLLAISPQSICRINVGETPTIDTLYHDSRPEVFISDGFTLNGKLFHVKNRALIYLSNSATDHQLLDGLPSGEDFQFSFRHGETIFFGSTKNRLYTFKGERLEPFTFSQLNYAAVSKMVGGISINNESIAFYTVNGGCIIVNTRNKSSQIINYFTGLPDDEVYALGVDRDGGLWISHAMGISRADMGLPIANMTFYPGLRGNIFAAVEFQGYLLVGTSEGLYKLNEVREYRVKEVIVQSAPETKYEKLDQSEKTENEQVDNKGVEAKKKSFLQRLFSRKTAATPEEETSSRVLAETKIQTEPTLQTPVQKKKLYELQSINFSYQKIDGLTGKIRSLNAFGSKLIIGASSGLFEMQNQSIASIAQGINVLFVEPISSSNQLLVATDRGAFQFKYMSGSWVKTKIFETENQIVTSIAALSESEAILATEFEVFLVNIKNTTSQRISSDNEFSGNSKPVVRSIGDDVVIITTNKTVKFDRQTKKLVEYKLIEGEEIRALICSQENLSWLQTHFGWHFKGNYSSSLPSNVNLLGLFANLNGIFVDPKGGLIVVDKFSSIYRIGSTPSELSSKPLALYLRQVNGSLGELIDPQSIKLSYSNSSLRITIGAPLFVIEGGVRYQYRIDGLNSSWSEWTDNTTIDFPYFPAGEFVVVIRARDMIGRLSEPILLPISISPPFWQTVPFYIAVFFFLAILIVVFVSLREQKLRKERDLLEQKVKERTQTIEEQKEELMAQRDELARYNEEILQQKEEIEAQRDEIEMQRDQIFKQNDEITKSIVYAKRIQTAVMPSTQLTKSLLAKHFIFFRPRDIVSGDFYWMTERKGKVLIVAADCTGHGVPGAFMSMMGVSLLNDIVNVSGVTAPNEILNQLRTKIKSTLWQTGKEGEARDGMDIAICSVDREMGILQYSGAYNPLYLFKKGHFHEQKADKMPVGVHVNEKESFSLHEIEIEKGDRFYIFSDGYVSQFGGPEGKKFMARPFKELLAQIQSMPLAQHAKILADNLDSWQSHYDQVDDILVIGVEID